MLRQALTKLSEQTSVAIVLRKIVEFNFRMQKSAIRRFLSLAKEERVLDIGCGTGEFAPLFPHAQYDGIDIDPSNIAYAKRHYPYRFKTGDATRIAFPSRTFDAILVVGVLHHLKAKDCELACAEMKRVLKHGGRLLIMEDTKSKRLVTRFMHRLDKGAFIRSKEEWRTLLERYFVVSTHWTFNNGVCFYSAFVLKNEKE